MEMNISDVTFRRLKPEDLDVLIKYRMMFLTELQNPSGEEKKPLLEKSLTNYFSRALKDDTFIAMAAEYRKQPVSFGGMVVQEIPGHFNFLSGKQGYILNMYTLPEYRGKGLSTMLLKNLLDEARSGGMTKVYLHATDEGINIYRKAGFGATTWPVLEMKL
jgi:GNAT superfamily N-acetyltransferase